MAIEIKIPDGLIPALKKGFDTYLQKTEVEIDLLELEVAKANSKLNATKLRRDELKDVLRQIEIAKKFASKPIKSADYNTLWKWSDKIKFVLSYANEPLTSGDIIQYIGIKEPEYRNDETNKRTLAQTVSRELSKHKKDKDYYVVGTNDSNRSLYGLITWKNKK